MTPLELEIAIHYAAKGGDYREGDFSAKAVMEAICWFAKEGMLELCKAQDPMCQRYQATDKLKFFVDHLCTIQLPVCSWSIPVDPGNFGLSEGRIAEARAIKRRNDEVVAGMIGNR